MLNENDVEELRRCLRQIQRILGASPGARPYLREGRPSVPLAPILEGDAAAKVRQALEGVDEATTVDLCELLGIPQAERGRATLTRLGQELRALGWQKKRGGRRGPTRMRVYRRPAGERLKACVASPEGDTAPREPAGGAGAAGGEEVGGG